MDLSKQLKKRKKKKKYVWINKSSEFLKLFCYGS